MSDAPLVRVAFPAGPPPRDGVALVTLDRPAVHNALSFALLAELEAALVRLDRDPACRAIVVAGAGDRAFAAGADLRELAAATPASLVAGDPLGPFDRIGRLATPLVAAVRGHALGGGFELALACDLVVAGDDARFAFPEVGLGLIPGAGGTQRIARLVGRTTATRLVLLGEPLDAAAAERLGIVARVVPAAEAVEQALDLAARIAALPHRAVLAAKAAIRRAEEAPLSEGLRHEREAFAALLATEDRGEGIAAFLERRPPAWRHR